ncbi:hypothetical protein AGLY_012654 [Aphis glycines]|uniref:Uncharacterized protein n=1 Tax=Aphis glycines TaxID=307491 RepID=A0A6G0TB34_APHGL|nr:hypothetical protein AGLY_012654 [Aphis glycines]
MNINARSVIKFDAPDECGVCHYNCDHGKTLTYLMRRDFADSADLLSEVNMINDGSHTGFFKNINCWALYEVFRCIDTTGITDHMFIKGRQLEIRRKIENNLKYYVFTISGGFYINLNGIIHQEYSICNRKVPPPKFEIEILFRQVMLYTDTKKTETKFDFYVSKYSKNYSALEYEIKNLYCHSKNYKKQKKKDIHFAIGNYPLKFKIETLFRQVMLYRQNKTHHCKSYTLITSFKI